jgi:hypothetical protein
VQPTCTFLHGEVEGRFLEGHGADLINDSVAERTTDPVAPGLSRLHRALPPERSMNVQSMNANTAQKYGLQLDECSRSAD